MNDFTVFARLTNERLNELKAHELFVTVDGDALWDIYLAAFPEGTNPIYRERTEHDCSCCRNFIKNFGNVVAIVNGELVSIWDVEGAPAPYDVVAKALHEAVTGHPITNLFRTSETKYGAEHNFEKLEDGEVKKWHHFWGEVSNTHRTATPDKARGDYRTQVQTYKRGLEELTSEALTLVLDLIQTKALYRGEEHKRAVEGFYHHLMNYRACEGEREREIMLWQEAGGPAAHFRNSVIGTLVQDLSEGKDLEYAVKAFETKVAPANYKRPTALITQGMVDQAMKTIDDLGLEPALHRRLARLSDVSINDVLWASNKAKSKMQGGVADLLAGSVKTQAPKAATDIGIDAFMADVLPSTKNMALFFSNQHAGNRMVITAPTHADAPRLFKWGNGFGWSYAGNVTDSIKERVKKAGGSVEGDLCCRLAWDYTDDLDFHMFEPGYHIYFGTRRRLSLNGGMLDVDANGTDGIKDEPVENIFYKDSKKMGSGAYRLVVHNYSRRSDGAGFEVEIEANGEVISINTDKVLRTGSKIEVATITVKDGKIVEINVNPELCFGRRSSKLWGVDTENFIDVSTVMLSPNHWGDNVVGNKHYFFVLDGCMVDEPMRGIYNEFLRGELEQHRKVFEVLGNKTKCEPDIDGMSGLGFSSTRDDEVVVRCDGRLYNVKF